MNSGNKTENHLFPHTIAGMESPKHLPGRTLRVYFVIIPIQEASFSRINHISKGHCVVKKMKTNPANLALIWLNTPSAKLHENFRIDSFWQQVVQASLSPHRAYSRCLGKEGVDLQYMPLVSILEMTARFSFPLLISQPSLSSAVNANRHCW